MGGATGYGRLLDFFEGGRTGKKVYKTEGNRKKGQTSKVYLSELFYGTKLSKSYRP